MFKLKKSHCAIIMLAASPSIALAFNMWNRNNDNNNDGNGNTIEEPASADPVPTGPPNAENQKPAFPEQTRAPERVSQYTLKTETILDNLNYPWAIEFMPDGRLLMSQRSGTLSIVSQDGTQSSPILGLPEVADIGQGGLMDVLLSENFETDRMVYFSYAEPREASTNATAVARGTLNSAGSLLRNVEVLFHQEPPWDSSKHFGSRLAWGADGMLYISTGERSLPEPRELAQDLTKSLGKVIRIKPDGSAPSDNPFANNPRGLDEIWSYGHRNIQGIARHPVSNKIWTIEHGPKGGDELNVPEPGKNYGWPTITYGEDYTGVPIGNGITQKSGLEQPVYYWDPVIAPASMTFYDGTLFPEWRNNILIGSLNPGGIVRIMLDGEKVIGEERLEENLGRVRDVMVAPDGAIWAVTDRRNGKLVRISR